MVSGRCDESERVKERRRISIKSGLVRITIQSENKLKVTGVKIEKANLKVRVINSSDCYMQL